MVNTGQTLTLEEIMLRFKKVLGRDMTPAEKRVFFLPPENQLEPDPEKQ
jgi:hypothetical protein